MKTVVGIFTSLADAEIAIQRLHQVDVPNKNINLLVPGATEEELEAVPTTETEGPGMAKMLGGVVGGTAAAAGGVQLGSEIASLLIPGIGPVVAIGLAAGALLGAGGAIGGAAAGEALEESLTKGVPRDEMFVYEDALRQGRNVLIVLADDKAEAEGVRDVLVKAGAEDIDSAHKKWWIGLRDAEKEVYEAKAGDFEADEPIYRHGFEAALLPRMRGKSYDEVVEELRERFPNSYQETAFRHGYERGQTYYQAFTEERKR